MLVLNKWEHLRMEEQMDIVTFFTKVYDTKRELQRTGHPQTTGVLVYRVMSRLPARFRQIVQQIRLERIMPTWEERHARLQMEENFQLGERKHDPEEALVMCIRNVVRRRFSQPSQLFGSYHRMPGQGNFQVNRLPGPTSQDFVYYRCIN